MGYISTARIDAFPEKVFEGAPDLAREVISPSESARLIREKVTAYLEAGAALVWVVYPEDESVDVIRLNEDGTRLTRTVEKSGTLTGGGDLLPGLEIPLVKVFRA